MILLYYVCLCACVYVCALPVYSTHRDQKRAADPLVMSRLIYCELDYLETVFLPAQESLNSFIVLLGIRQGAKEASLDSSTGTEEERHQHFCFYILV